MSLKKQKGFSLIDLALTLTFSTMVVGAGLYFQVRSERDARLSAVGDQLVKITNAAGRYNTEKYAQLKSASPVVAGFATPMQPSISELVAAGYLEATDAGAPAYGGGFTIEMQRVPATCVPPACDVAYSVFLRSPIYKPGTSTPDVPGANTVAMRAGGNGGASSLETPTIISGAGGQWNIVNPFGVAAIAAARGGYGAAGFDQFYRRDGSLPLTNALAGGGQDANDLKNVNASGTVNAQHLVASGNASVTGNISGSGNLNVTGNSTLGTTTSTTTINGTTNLRDNVNLGATGTDVVRLYPIAVEGTACPDRGIAYASDGSSLLFCKSGRWSKTAGMAGWKLVDGASCSTPAGASGTYAPTWQFCASTGAWSPIYNNVCVGGQWINIPTSC